MPMFAAPDAKGQPKVTIVMKIAALMVATPFAWASAPIDALGETRASVTLEGATISLHTGPSMAAALLADLIPLGADEQLVFLSIDLNEGWKTYWRLPGRFGLAPDLDWQRSDNVAAATAHFPAPILFDEGDGTSIGYAAPTVWPIVLQPEDSDRPMTYRLSLEIGLCAVLCLPERVELSAPSDSSSVDQDIALAKIFALHDDLAQGTQPLSALSLERGDDQISVAGSPMISQNEPAQNRRGLERFAVVEDAGGRHSVLHPAESRFGEAPIMSGPWTWPTPITRVTVIEPGAAMHVYTGQMTSTP
ncbi:MAG: protein-disulfide reductase DsbD domain-containing protein [Hyphomicrobiales bacterium]